MLFRYSRWDGTQNLSDLDADDLLAAMSDDLMSDGDLWSALRRMFQRGTQDPQGQRMPGIQDLLDRLRKRRQEQLNRYDLGSALDDIKKRLDEILKTERAGIERQVQEPGERARKLDALDKLPPEPAGRIKELQDYNFTDKDAERQFQELMKSLQQQMMQPFMQGMKQALDGMSADDMKRMREMLRDINRMLRQRAEGDEPDFDAFKEKWGQNFPGVESLDELLDQIARQTARMQSLMESMSPEQRRQLQEMMSSLFMKDERLEAEMAQFAMHLDEFGDPFLLDLKETLMNAVERNGAGTPLRLTPEDFEVFRTELSTQASTVVMLDMSRSMINNGYFLPAKKVALALTALIRGQFPRDSLYILGFSLYARQFKAEDLPKLAWSEWNIGTNMHHGFQLSRQLLGRQKGGNKQIIMITDGEPTAHMEGLEADLAYPPTRRTFEETLKEVQRCTRDGITINTFMLEQSRMLTQFIEQLTRINKGRAFFASPDRLGEYILVDYVRNKRRAIA